MISASKPEGCDPDPDPEIDDDADHFSDATGSSVRSRK